MGMDFVPVYEDAGTAANYHPDRSPVTVQRMNMKAGLVTRGPVLSRISHGRSVAYDEAGPARYHHEIRGLD